MLVVYRACSVGSSKPRPIEGKIELVRRCYESFLEAFKGVDYELKVLLDKPSAELREIFGPDCEETFYGSFTEGNTKSFHRQIDLALEAEDDFLFVEDDYLWIPGAGKVIQDTLEELPFITPYLHPGYFTEDTHNYKKEVRLVNDRVWFGVVSTTLTFGGKYQSLLEEHETMRKYGWADHPMWCDITQRIPLYTPANTLATHCETPWLAPTYDWFEMLQTPPTS